MVKKTVFVNGLRVLLVPQPASLAATVLVLVEAGSEYETKRINGISHFLEHLMFKGTARRPQPGMISRELDALGAEYNAFTSQEYTGYWAKVQREKLPQALDIVSDLYLNPIFNPQEIEKERGVVIEELNLYEDTPMRRVQELFLTVLYGDQPAGWDVGGRKEIIRSLKQIDFLKYRSAHYVAPATVVVVAGAFNEKEVTRMIRSIFGGLPRKPKVTKTRTRERQRKPETFIKFKDTDQSHLVLGTRAWNIFDKRRYALQVLADVLGGGMSARLWHRIREELGAAYYVRATTDLFLDHGYFSVSAGVDVKRIEQVIKVILEEMDRVKRDAIPAEELQKAKDHMVGNLILSLESSDELASFYGGQEILTRSPEKPEETIRRIRAVTAREVQGVAKALFRNEKLNLAAIGPHKNPAPFRKILKL